MGGALYRSLIALSVVTLVCLSSRGSAHHVDDSNERLTRIGPAANFELIAQNGKPLSIQSLRGKVVAVAFTYTRCIDTCPLLTANMVQVQNRLGDRFGDDVFFVTVTMDPEIDRPQVLREYAGAMGSNLDGWAFVTGSENQIRRVARDYGIYRKVREDGEVDHTLLTSIIDRSGTTRVQYIGMRFDPDEFVHDLVKLIGEDDPA